MLLQSLEGRWILPQLFLDVPTFWWFASSSFAKIFIRSTFVILLEPGEQTQGVAGGKGGVDRTGSIRKSCFLLRASVPLLSLDGVAKKSSDCHGLTSPRILRSSKAWYGRTPPILLSDVDTLLFDSMGSLLSDVGVWSWD
jgi:hypothetical protein